MGHSVRAQGSGRGLPGGIGNNPSPSPSVLLWLPDPLGALCVKAEGKGRDRRTAESLPAVRPGDRDPVTVVPSLGFSGETAAPGGHHGDIRRIQTCRELL